MSRSQTTQLGTRPVATLRGTVQYEYHIIDNINPGLYYL